MTRLLSKMWHWMGTPWRAMCQFLRAIIDLTQRQMRSIFSAAMLLGIVALSTQNMVLIYWVGEVLGLSSGSLFGQMSLAQQWWNNLIILIFCVSVALVVWGADYLKAKYGDHEIDMGKRDEEDEEDSG